MTGRSWIVLWALVGACGRPPAAGSEAPAKPTTERAHYHGHGHGHGQSNHAHDGSPHRFSDPEKWSKVFDDPKREAWQKPAEVVKELGLAPDDVVADLGAGTGYFTVRLARAVPKGRVLAIDNEPSMVEFTKQRATREGLANIEGIVASESDPKLPDGVDLVLIVDTYHHLTERVAYMDRVRQRLADKGRVVIVDFKMGKLPVGPPDSHKISRETLESEMKQAGYALCRSWDGLPYQYTLFFSERC